MREIREWRNRERGRERGIERGRGREREREREREIAREIKRERECLSWCSALLDGAEAALLRLTRGGFGPTPGLRALLSGVRPSAFPQTELCSGGRGSE